MLARIRKTRTTTELAQEAARQLRVLTGFDRVMVYRFHLDGSGEVIAEAATSGLESVPRPALPGFGHSEAGAAALSAQLAADHRRHQ